MSDEVIDEISDILLETPLDGIVATNGTHRREGLHTSHIALDKIGSGRLSGAPLTQRAVEVVRRIHTRSGGNFPIIGVGGIMSPADAKAMLDAGADLLQLYTGYIYEGPGLVGEICRSLIADAEAAAAAKAAAEARAEEEAGLLLRPLRQKPQQRRLQAHRHRKPGRPHPERKPPRQPKRRPPHLQNRCRTRHRKHRTARHNLQITNRTPARNSPHPEPQILP